MNKYEPFFLDITARLDEMLKASGEVHKLATMIVESNSKSATIALMKKTVSIANNSTYSDDVKKVAKGVNTSLLDFYGYQMIQKICELDHEEDTRSLDELLTELNSLIGLEKVKSKVQDLIMYQKVQKLRSEKNLNSSKNTLHLAFTGNPGTGKTTVARIVGRIYKQIGLLSKGHFVEVSRTDLIAGYQGQTALKVKKVIESAKGGVLFIDEAYSITENNHSDSYGRECLTELTKALEDYREDLVVIVAGYTEPMTRFFESNPGLKSRFNTFIEFNDYSAVELQDILISMCHTNDYKLDDGAKAECELYFEKKIADKGENFSNGRLVRNLYDTLVMNHAKRVIHIENPSCEDLSVIKEKDFKLIIDEIE